MKHTRPDFGEFSAEKLQQVIETNDITGRFEFKEGFLRKVPKCSRRRRSVPQWEVSNHQQPLRMHGRSQSLSSAQSGGCSPTPMEVEGSRLEESPGPPLGEHWTKYQDDGQIWWYYEGRQWWCANEHMTPQRYHDA